MLVAALLRLSAQHYPHATAARSDAPLCFLRRGDRVTYRRRKSFRTVSNKVRKVKTPGGKLVLHYTGKKGSNPICGDPGCDQRLHGVRSPSAPPHPLPSRDCGLRSRRARGLPMSSEPRARSLSCCNAPCATRGGRCHGRGVQLQQPARAGQGRWETCAEERHTAAAAVTLPVHAPARYSWHPTAPLRPPLPACWPKRLRRLPLSCRCPPCARLSTRASASARST